MSNHAGKPVDEIVPDWLIEKPAENIVKVVERAEEFANDAETALKVRVVAPFVQEGLKKIKSRIFIQKKDGSSERISSEELAKQLAPALIESTGVFIAPVEGKLPEYVICKSCSIPVKRKRGPVPIFCRACAKRRKLAVNKKRLENPAIKKRQQEIKRKWRLENPVNKKRQKEMKRKWLENPANRERDRELKRKWLEDPANKEMKRVNERKRYHAKKQSQPQKDPT